MKIFNLNWQKKSNQILDEKKTIKSHDRYDEISELVQKARIKKTSLSKSFLTSQKSQNPL